jgi:hypothetical protein
MPLLLASIVVSEKRDYSRKGMYSFLWVQFIDSHAEQKYAFPASQPERNCALFASYAETEYNIRDG